MNSAKLTADHYGAILTADQHDATVENKGMTWEIVKKHASWNQVKQLYKSWRHLKRGEMGD